MTSGGWVSVLSVGRVGVLAAALGVGAVLVAVPGVAAADEGGVVERVSAGPVGSGAAGPRAEGRSRSLGVSSGRRGGSAGPVVRDRVAASVMADGGGGVGGGMTGRASVALGRATADARFDRVPAVSAMAASGAAVLGVSAGAVAANPVSDLIRVFIGDGTASNPNGGILVGNGYSWTAATCTGSAPCTGGNGGLVGSGGDGYNGGAGGNAGVFGDGGDGGAGVPGGAGGAGGLGGLLFGSGGAGGAGGDAPDAVSAGGAGGAGGSAGSGSVWGRGGAGGAGSTNPAHGGRGIENDILGVSYYWGGGGGPR